MSGKKTVKIFEFYYPVFPGFEKLIVIEEKVNHLSTGDFTVGYKIKDPESNQTFWVDAKTFGILFKQKNLF